MNLLTAKNLFFTKNSQFILNDITFTMLPSEITCLLGSNGSGKSTMLKCVAGVEPLSFGTLSLNGELIQNFSDKKRAHLVGWLPQHLNRPYSMTVQEFLSVKHPHYFTAACDMFEVLPMRDKLIEDLSGGEWKRCQLAWLSQQNFKVILMDEPDSALDMRFKKTLIRFCKESVKKNNAIILVATHDIDFAREIATSVYALWEGRLVWKSPACDFWKSPVIDKIFSTKVFT